MKLKLITFSALLLLFVSCANRNIQTPDLTNSNTWTYESLNQKASDHLDSSKRDISLFNLDINTYEKYAEIFQSYPLNKSPFPVAEYEYAVSNLPFTIEMEGSFFKGVRVGECVDFDCEKVVDKLTLFVLTNDKEAEETTMVDSRNFPYLTAQGIIKFSNHEYDWVFSASPDGFSTLLLNMKLFDLRFGETVVIYPQIDKSFLYEQIKDSPNNYENFEQYKSSILANQKIQLQLKSLNNVNVNKK